MSTPGRRRALRALGAAKRKNRERYERGEKTAIIGGKQVSFNTMFKNTGGKPESWERKK